MTTITEIAADIFRICNYDSASGLQFSQFLVRDDEPLLYHAGQNALFADILDAVASLIRVEELHWIGFSHFEADECGALNRWLQRAPHATALAGLVAAKTSVEDIALRPPRILQDGEAFSTGSHSFRFLATPHVPHNWEASLLFDESQALLFCSDVLTQRGRTPALSGDVLGPAVQALEQGQQGPFRNVSPYTSDTNKTLLRLAELTPQTLAIMHGASYTGDGASLLRDYDAELLRVLRASGAA